MLTKNYSNDKCSDKKTYERSEVLRFFDEILPYFNKNDFWSYNTDLIEKNPIINLSGKIADRELNPVC